MGIKDFLQGLWRTPHDADRELLAMNMRVENLEGAAARRDPRSADEDPRWSAVKALVVSGSITIVVLAATVGLLLLLNPKGNSGPEAALSLVFVAAAVVLILVVCTLTIVMKRLRLTDHNEAMGLPKGSVRAVIALLLIMLFFIAALFLFNNTRNLAIGEPADRTLSGLTAERFATIPTDAIQSVSTRSVGGVSTYDVVLYRASGNTPSSDDIAKQLITTLATLVTAVAAFYFGANSVSSAMKRPGAGGARPVPDDIPIDPTRGGPPATRDATSSSPQKTNPSPTHDITASTTGRGTAKTEAARSGSSEATPSVTEHPTDGDDEPSGRSL